MQCTPEQIEEKRRLAQKKLAEKYAQTGNKSISSPYLTYNLNIPQPSLRQNGFNQPSSSYKSIPSPKSSKFKPYEKPKTPVLNFYGKKEIVNGTCYMITDRRFAVDLTGFSTPAIDIFKTMPSRSYNPRTKIWDFDLKDYDLLQSKLTTLHPDVVVGKLPNFVLNCCRTEMKNDNNVDLSKIDSELFDTLMPFQVDGVCFGIDKDGRCLIADDMGLGKTFQALAIASYYKENWPLLIVTTASMKNVWEQTIFQYLPSVPVMQVQYMISGKDYISEAKILIVSHDMMSRCINKLSERNFGVIIIDESHVFKNFKAKCTKSATQLAKKARRIVLLSGTPALSRPSELYTQLALIDEKFFGNFMDYSKRYCDGKTTSFGWDSSGKSNLQELEIILGKKFMIRRTKTDILKDLPNKKQEIVTLDVNLKQLCEEDRLCLNALADKYNNQKGGEKHAILLTFFSETARIKIPSVCSYILQILDTEKKFLVFAHHQKMLDAIEKILLKRNKKYIRIDGNTSSDQRKYFVDKFQVDDNCVCAILSITAANAGITLTAASLVIFAELHWNPSILSQAESRAHRIGQENTVIVRYLLAPGTADDSIWPLLQEKQKILEEVGLAKGTFDDVTIFKQEMSNADFSGAGSTTANTLDISTYFKPLDVVNEVKNDCSNYRKDSESLMDAFNDDFEDLVSNLDF